MSRPRTKQQTKKNHLEGGGAARISQYGLKTSSPAIYREQRFLKSRRGLPPGSMLVELLLLTEISCRREFTLRSPTCQRFDVLARLIASHFLQDCHRWSSPGSDRWHFGATKVAHQRLLLRMRQGAPCAPPCHYSRTPKPTFGMRQGGNHRCATTSPFTYGKANRNVNLGYSLSWRQVD